MSGTMSGGSSDWLHFYQPNNLSDQPPLTAADMGFTGEISTANITSATNSPQLGRVNRTNTRRRTRASRRTPTTLVTTDTTNFRAMVQQFTGGSVAGDQTFNPGDGSNQYLGTYDNNNSANLSFVVGPNGSVMAAATASGGHNLQFRQSLVSGGGGGGQPYHQGENHQAFLQRLQNYVASEVAGEIEGPTQSKGFLPSSIEAGERDYNQY